MKKPPAIGRTVHFVLATGNNIGAHRPAVITNVISADGICALTVLPDASRDGIGFILCTSSTMHSEDARPGTWHWPELTPERTGDEAGREPQHEEQSAGRGATAEGGDE